MELGGVAYETVCRRLCSDIGCRRSAISRHIYLRWPTDATRTSWAVSAKRERASVFSLGEGNSHSLCDCLRLLKCVLRDHNSNNCTHSGNVCRCTYMVNTDYDKFRSFSRLYVTLLRHRTYTYLHGRADRFLVLVSDGQVAALSDWAYYQ